MIRGSKVGDTVAFQAFAGKPPVVGGIVAIQPDGERLRTIATLDGYVYKTAGELLETSETVDLRRLGDLRAGDTIVLFNGMRRTLASAPGIAGAVPAGSPRRLQVEFAENDKPLTVFQRHTGYEDDLWLVVP